LRDQFAGFFRPPWSSETAGAAPAAGAHLKAPALGPAREQILRAQRAFEAWNRLAQAQGKLQRMWSDTLRSAAAAFTSRLQSAGSVPSAEAIDGLYDQWIECAEQAYSSTAHSDAFSDALSEHVNAAADWRRESTAGIEDWAKFWDLPTRSEINTLTKRLREIERMIAATRSASSEKKARPGDERSASTAKAKRAPRRKPAGPKRSR
jgi:class III poly(R)-hydroxyalkanoic acid synthase PhaE subunit